MASGAELPPGPYSVILADPPWTFIGWSQGSDRSPDEHYQTMDLGAIKALPVESIAADDAILLLWATMPLLPGALEVMSAWGFEYKTAAFTLVKHTAGGSPFFGLGYYTRANAELCLLGRRGKGLPVKDHGVSSLIQSQRREHSRKPDIYHPLRRLFGPQRSLEMFARRHPPGYWGWTGWGNELSDLAQPELPEEVQDADEVPGDRHVHLPL